MEGHTDEVSEELLADGRILVLGLLMVLYDSGMGKAENQLGLWKATLMGYGEPNYYRMAESYHGLGMVLYDCGMGKAENQLGLWKAIRTQVDGANLLPDGRILSWTYDGTLRLWDGESGEPVGIMEGHTDGVDGAKHELDGRILSWSWDGTIRLWNGESGEPVGIMEGHTAEVSGVELIRMAKSFYGLGMGLYDCGMGKAENPLAVLNWPQGFEVSGVELLPDGGILLVLGWDFTILGWGNNGELVGIMEGHTDRFRGAKLLPDGNILSWSWDGTLRLWDGERENRLGLWKATQMG